MRPPSRAVRRTALLVGLAVTLTASSLVAPPAAATPQPDTSAGSAVPAGPTVAAGKAFSSTITLISGHVVHYSETLDGRGAATLVRAPDSNRSSTATVTRPGST